MSTMYCRRFLGNSFKRGNYTDTVTSIEMYFDKSTLMYEVRIMDLANNTWGYGLSVDLDLACEEAMKEVMEG